MQRRGLSGSNVPLAGRGAVAGSVPLAPCSPWASTSRCWHKRPPALLPAHRPGPPSAPATLHLEPPGAAASAFKTSSQCLKKKKKIHKTQFLEVNNSDTSEKQKLKPAQYQTDTQNMQVADAWLASRGSTRSLRSQGPLARLVWVSKPPQIKRTPSPRAQETYLVPFQLQAPQPSPSCAGTGFGPRARSRESSPTVLSCQTFYNSTTIAQELSRGQTD